MGASRLISSSSCVTFFSAIILVGDLVATMALSFLVASDDGYRNQGWDYARATFYGDIHGNETMRKCVCACVYD